MVECLTTGIMKQPKNGNKDGEREQTVSPAAPAVGDSLASEIPAL